jgi:hypothetical protein
MTQNTQGKAGKYVIAALLGGAALAGAFAYLKPAGEGGISSVRSILSSAVGRKGPVCVKVNAGHLSGPATLFTVNPGMLEGGFIDDLRRLKPEWKIFHESEKAPCEPWFIVNVVAESVVLDQFSYGVPTTSGVGAGIAIYAPAYGESSGISVATAATFPALTTRMAEAADKGFAQLMETGHEPRKAPAEDNKVCIALSADDEHMAEDVITNFAYVNRQWTVYSRGDPSAKDTCKPDFYMTVTSVPLADTDGRSVGGGYVMSLRQTGKTETDLIIALGKSSHHEMIEVINDSIPKIKYANWKPEPAQP